MKPPWRDAPLCGVAPGLERVDGLLFAERCRALCSRLRPQQMLARSQGFRARGAKPFTPKHGEPGGPSSLTACTGRSPVTTPAWGKGTDPASHPLPSGGPHAAKSTSRRRFPALCENVQFVAPSLTLKNVPLFTMLFPLITVRLQEIFLENCFRLAGITVLSQGWKTHLNLFLFYPKKSLSPEGSDKFG